MNPFKKTVRPCSVMEWSRTGKETPARVFCEIELDAKGELTISGVIGPLSSGDARGSCGQIDSALQQDMDAGKVESYAEGWNQDRLRQFLGIWNRWHLNHMHAYDDAMRRDGWLAQRDEVAWLHKFTLSRETLEERRKIEENAKKRLLKGDAVTYTQDEIALLKAPYSVQIITETETPPATPERYAPAMDYVSGGGKVATRPERKTMGWLRPDEHPRGLLGKVHPETGNGYGSAWYKEDVPEDVLAWLRDLPEADAPHPWGSR